HPSPNRRARPMTAQRKSLTKRRLLTACALVLATGLSGAVLAQDAIQQLNNELANEQATVMYISVDKPIYRPGETMWFRSWEVSLKNYYNFNYGHGGTFQLIEPRRSVVQGKLVYANGVGAWIDFGLDANLVGGEYTLRMTGQLGTFNRPGIVSVYEPPR